MKNLPIPALKASHSLAIGICLALANAHAAVNPPPATPLAITPNEVTQGSSYVLTVQGESVNGSAFIASEGKKSISAQFSGTGIKVDSITFVDATTLSISVTVIPAATISSRSLTITNPDGLSATSPSDVLNVVIGVGNGIGNNNAPPATPSSISPSQVAQGSTATLQVDADSINGSAFDAGQGSKLITASFSGNGITINTITVTSTTTLTLGVTVDPAAPFGDRTLTVTNPDGQTITGTATLYVSDAPVIVNASITPSTPCSLNELHANVGNLINLDGLPVTYTYQWLEDGIDTGYRSATLPPQATQPDKTYTCLITPLKGSITGIAHPTPAITIPRDKDGNGIHDEWEGTYFGSCGIDPNADSDADGLSNKTEYLFGLNPLDNQSKKAIKSAPNRSSGVFEYTRPVKKTDQVSYKVWTSTDLVIWTEQSTIAESTTQADEDTEVVQVTLPSAVTSMAAKLFVRVSAE